MQDKKGTDFSVPFLSSGNFEDLVWVKTQGARLCVEALVWVMVFPDAQQKDRMVMGITDPPRGKAMIKGIFWDNDGVLVDTESLYFQASAEVLDRIGVHLSREDFIETSLVKGQSVLDLAREESLPAGGMTALRRRRDELYCTLLQQGVKAMAEVENTLRQLHGKVAMAIVTSCRREHFDLIHRSTGLLKFFDFILTREDYTHSKPHPEPYLAALARSGLSPGECLVVEDTERGLLSATGAGIRCLVVPGELTRENDFSAADRVLQDIREVASFIL